MDARPWKRERIIELPRLQRSTEPLPVIASRVYCGACGGSFTVKDVFCGSCGALLQRDGAVNEYATLPFGLTGVSWQRC
jgi:hypothetical protein